jgi:uncharacterized protein
MTRVAVTGATGTIGQAVCRALLRRGDELVALTRYPDRARSVLPDGIQVEGWDEPSATPPPVGALAGAEAVVHLLGEPVAQRWSADAKQRIHDSRVLSTRMLVAVLHELPDGQRPRVLISQSATGYYGPTGDRELDEQAAAGSDYLAGVVSEWEAEAQRAAKLVRVGTTRTGVVITPSGGALAKMLPFFRAGVGGPVAGGHQYVPWIHIKDVVAALLFCLDNSAVAGAINLTAPNPVDNREFSRALGRALHRPAVLPVPGFALRLLYGDMAAIITTGQRAVPRRLLSLGFSFSQPAIEPALCDVLRPRSG